MPLEYDMQRVSLDDIDLIEQALRQWEPFAIYKGEVYFRRQFHNEDREPLSSTREENKVVWDREDEDDGA